MVIGILFVIQVVSTTVSWLHTGFGLLLFLKGILSGLIEDGAFAFTVITLGFIVISCAKAQSFRSTSEWTPESLPPAGPHWRYISLQDIFSDLATYTFLLIIIWYPLAFNEPQAAFFSDSALHFLSWFSPVIVAGIGLSIWQLRARWWSQPMQISNIAVNTALVMAILYLAMSGPLLQVGADLTSGLTPLGIERATTTALLILACFPAYEVLRDSRRLLQSRATSTTVNG